MDLPRTTERLSHTAQLRAFREGTRSPRQALEHCLEAIDRLEGSVKAFAALGIEDARARADEATRRYADGRPLSPIDGMVVGVKDIIDTADFPTEMNSPLFTGNVPKADAAAVRAVRQGGGIIIGKTVTTEFAVGRSGPTTHPLAPERTPGGSSSGSAAGAAAGFFDAAFGTQTQGSTIRPASFCGVVGYKPTLHALPTAGVHPLSGALDHLGLIAGDLDDAWSLARWVSQVAPQPGHRGLDGPLGVPLAPLSLSRVALLKTAGFDELDADTAAAFEDLLSRLSGNGVAIVAPQDDAELQSVVTDLEDVSERSLDVLAFEMQTPFADFVATSPDAIGPRIHDLMERARAMSRDAYRDHLAFRDSLRTRVARLRAAYDAFLLPAASEPAPEGLDYTGRRTMLVYWTFLGLPAFSLPLMSVRGLPFGLQVAGFEHGDYALARQCRFLMELGRA